MKKGDKVLIYEDPITCNKLEGEATFCGEFVSEGYWEGRELIRCNVKFEEEPNKVYIRRVLVPLAT